MASLERVFALGIDPGLSRCGYGAVRGQGGRLSATAFGHLTTPVSDPLSERLAALWEELTRLLEQLQPDVMVVERVLFQVNARTAMAVGQASGLALAAAARAGCPVAMYSPNEVKLAVAGYGSATKDQVQRMVQVLLGLRPSPPARRTGPTPSPWRSATCPGPGSGPRPPRRCRSAGRRQLRRPGVIGSLRGIVLDRAARPGQAAEVLLEVGGVGYRVLVPGGALGRIGAPGSPAFLHVHTHVREDALVLYGFPTRDERVCFEALIGAHGVGPAVALALLSVHSPLALQRAVLAEDTDALMLVPGIGKKTATRLIIELKTRLDVELDGADVQLVGVRVRPRRGPAGGGQGRPGPRPRCGPPCPGSATARTRSAMPCPACPTEGALEDQIRLALRELAGSDEPGDRPPSWRERPGEPGCRREPCAREEGPDRPITPDRRPGGGRRGDHPAAPPVERVRRPGPAQGAPGDHAGGGPAAGAAGGPPAVRRTARDWARPRWRASWRMRWGPACASRPDPPWCGPATWPPS